MAADPGPTPTPTDTTAVPPTYCGHCGDPLDAGVHAACERRLELEPPRYCRSCRRRMVVQVTPTAWTARCVQHGATGSGAAVT